MIGRYASAVALRQAIEDRLRAQAAESRRDPNWLRRRLVFARLLARLVWYSPDAWVLKGGMAVELRRPGLARATRDVDLVLRPGLVKDPGNRDHLREALVDALYEDPDGDGFVFRVGAPTRLRDDAYGRPAWRFHVEATLAGRRFGELRLDIVARPEEIGGAEMLKIPDVLGFAGVPGREICVADLRQQFAEKLHALTRSYAVGVSTRVKDLVDTVMLVEDGLPSDATLIARVRHVFAVRGTHAVPIDMQPPPDSWQDSFARLAAEVGLGVRTYGEAHQLVAAFWRQALADDGDVTSGED